MSPESEPRRIKLERTRGYRKPPGAIVVARPTKWGNPFRVGQDTITPYCVGAGWVRLGAPGAIQYPYDEGTWLKENPHRLIRCETNQQAVAWFRATLTELAKADIRTELAGRDLACWCRLDQPCHADVLLRVANGGAP